CTTLTATTSYSAARSPSSSSSACTSVTPRPDCAANGHVTLVNSPAATSTLAPSGTLAASNPTNADTAPPIATHAGGTPTRSANPRRARAVGSSKSAGRPRPVRQPCTAAVTASATGAGGMPTLAVLR